MVVLLLWLYLSAYVLLIGAELNAEIEREMAQSATTERAINQLERHHSNWRTALSIGLILVQLWRWVRPIRRKKLPARAAGTPTPPAHLLLRRGALGALQDLAHGQRL